VNKGFNCTTCKTYHHFGAYVAAHWDMLLIHTCNVCSAKHNVVNGTVSQTKKGKLPKVTK
jgi:hypothetical protein